MPDRKTPRKSPNKPRVLNRWDDDLDKGLLLCVQYACSEAGLKIPWARVAEIMGPTFTEGGIVQHLAKLRGLMAGVGIPVPPPVKRGMVTKSPSKIYGSAANPRVKPEPIAPLFPNGTTYARIKQEETEEAVSVSVYERAKRANNKLNVKDLSADAIAENEAVAAELEREQVVRSPAKAKGPRKGKNKSRRSRMSDEDEDTPGSYGSDSEYGSPKKRRRTMPKIQKTVAQAEVEDPTLSVPPQAKDSQDTEIAIKVEEAGPATRTRGVKRDYSLMAAGSSDELDVEVEDAAEQPQQAEQLAAESDIDQGEKDHTELPASDEDTDIEDNSGSDNDCGEVEPAESEAETEIAETHDTTTHAYSSQDFPQLPTVFDVPYGQISVDPSLSAEMSRRYPVANTGINSFDGLGYMNSTHQPPVNHFPYSNIATMGPMARHSGFGSHQIGNNGIYSASTQSSVNTSMGVSSGYSQMPVISHDNHFSTTLTFHNRAHDVISEQDHVDSMPSAELFFTPEGDLMFD